MELTADCYNINYPGGKEILDRCYELMAYSVFTAKTREYKNEGLSLFESIKRAIRYCESHDLMTDYFKNHESEVLTMVSFEWDADRAKEVAVEETRIATTKQLTTKFVLSLLADNVPLKSIVNATQLSPEEIEKIAKENRLAF